MSDQSIDGLAFTVILGKDISEYTTNPPYVKAAKMLQERGFDIRKGDTIKYVITKKGVKPLQLAHYNEIDIDKYVEYLKSMIEQILDPLDLDFNTIIGKPRQLNMSTFFNTDKNKTIEEKIQILDEEGVEEEYA